MVPGLAFQNKVTTIVGSTVTQDESFWNDVQNPLVLSQYNALGDTTASMIYSLGWTADSGDFLIQGAHAAAHPSAVEAKTDSNGGVLFTPTVDTLATLHFRYNYDLPGSLMEVFAYAVLLDNQTGLPFVELYVSTISAPGPVSGTYDRTAQVTLPAGCDCALSYEMRLVTGATNVAATDNGFVELSLSPVPEPAGFLPLALGALALRKRRSRP